MIVKVSLHSSATTKSFSANASCEACGYKLTVGICTPKSQRVSMNGSSLASQILIACLAAKSVVGPKTATKFCCKVKKKLLFHMPHIWCETAFTLNILQSFFDVSNALPGSMATAMPCSSSSPPLSSFACAIAIWKIFSISGFVLS